MIMDKHTFSFEDFLNKIGFQDNEIEKINNVSISNFKVNVFQKALTINEYLFYSLLSNSKAKDIELYNLKLFLLLAYNQFNKSLKFFITEEAALTHYSTLLTIAVNDKLKLKKLGISNIIYATRLINQRIVRLSCLEFQEVMLKKETVLGEKKYKKRTKAVNIIIPDFTQFTYEKAKNDLLTAFKKYKKYSLYVCAHWMLSPKFLDNLDSNHDIIKFAKLFKIYHVFNETQNPELEIIKTYKSKKEHTNIENDLIDLIKKYSLEKTSIGLARGIFIKNEVKSIL